jgi:hypothetical protein
MQITAFSAILILFCEPDFSPRQGRLHIHEREAFYETEKLVISAEES